MNLCKFHRNGQKIGLFIEEHINSEKFILFLYEKRKQTSMKVA